MRGRARTCEGVRCCAGVLSYARMRYARARTCEGVGLLRKPKGPVAAPLETPDRGVAPGPQVCLLVLLRFARCDALRYVTARGPGGVCGGNVRCGLLGMTVRFVKRYKQICVICVICGYCRHQVTKSPSHCFCPL
jgi:hypothetical protein